MSLHSVFKTVESRIILVSNMHVVELLTVSSVCLSCIPLSSSISRPKFSNSETEDTLGVSFLLTEMSLVDWMKTRVWLDYVVE